MGGQSTGELEVALVGELASRNRYPKGTMFKTFGKTVPADLATLGLSGERAEALDTCGTSGIVELQRLASPHRNFDFLFDSIKEAHMGNR